ncbi:MAG TPA: phage portal protein [Bacteroidota bacterium]
MQKALGFQNLTARIVLPWNQHTGISSMGADSLSFADKGYGGNVYVFSVVNQISSKCKSIKWSLYQVKQSREKQFKGYVQKSANGINKLAREVRQLKQESLEQVYDHRLNEMLEKPNMLQTWPEFIENVIAFKLVTGNSFVIGFRPLTGENMTRFTEIYPYRPMEVTIVAQKYPAPVIRYHLADLEKKNWAPDEVLHMKTTHLLNQRIGMSPIEPALSSVKQSNAYAEWNEQLTKNMGGIPGVLVIDDDTLDDKKVDAILRKFDERQAGAKNAGKPLVVGGKTIDYKQVAVSPKDMEWTKGVQLTANQIALAYEWPPELVGDTATKTYDNMRAMLKLAYNGKVIPEMNALRDALNEYLVQPWNDGTAKYFLDYNLEDIEILQEERTAVWTRTLQGWNGGLLTLNESRMEIGFDAIGSEGDIRQTPLGLMNFDSPQDENDKFDKAMKYLEGKGLREYREAA